MAEPDYSIVTNHVKQQNAKGQKTTLTLEKKLMLGSTPSSANGKTSGKNRRATH